MVGKDDIPYRMENHPVMFETTLTIPTNAFSPPYTRPFRERHLHRFASWNVRGRRRHRTHGLQELLTQGAFLGPTGAASFFFYATSMGYIKLWDFYMGSIGENWIYGVYMGFTWDLHGIQLI